MIERIATEPKLRPGGSFTASNTTVVLEPRPWNHEVVTLVLGPEQIEDIPVTASSKALARHRGYVPVVLGLQPTPADADSDAANHRTVAATCQAPVNGTGTTRPRRDAIVGGVR